jgi:hypothetical protein
MMKHAITLLFAVSFIGLSAQMSGTYTVSPGGSGSNNFTSITAAIHALYSAGINGAVDRFTVDVCWKRPKCQIAEFGTGTFSEFVYLTCRFRVSTA